MKRRLRKNLDPQEAKVLAGLGLGIAGIAVGLFCLIPWNESVGTLWTMTSALVTGMFHTRYLDQKRKKK